MKSLITILMFVFISVEGAGQVAFQKAYKQNGLNTQGPGTVQALNTPNNGLLLTGTYLDTVTSSWKLTVIKTDVAGNRLWAKDYTTNPFINATSITKNGGFIVVQIPALLYKFNDTGKVEWAMAYGNATIDFLLKNVKETKDGYIGVGSNNFAGNKNRVLLFKIDTLGNFLWCKQYGNENAGAMDLYELPSGDIIVAGSTASYIPGNSDRDALLLCTDKYGNLKWSKTYGSAQADEIIYTGQLAKNGDLILGGYMYDADSLSYSKIYLLRVDTTGTIKWSKAYWSGGVDVFNHLIETEDENIVLLSSLNFSYDLTLIKTNSSGNLLWAKTNKTQAHEWGSAIHQLADTGFMLFGGMQLDTLYKSLFLVKTDSSGNACFSQFETLIEDNVVTNDISIMLPTFNFSASQQLPFPSWAYTGNDTMICQTLINKVENDHPMQSEVIVYPNPSTGAFSFASVHPIDILEITDVTGITVYKQKLNASKATVYLTDRPRGVYFYTIFYKDNFTKGKLVIH